MLVKTLYAYSYLSLSLKHSSTIKKHNGSVFVVVCSAETEQICPIMSLVRLKFGSIFCQLVSILNVNPFKVGVVCSHTPCILYLVLWQSQREPDGNLRAPTVVVVC